MAARAEAEDGLPLTHTFCGHTVAARRPLLVGDARSHPLLKDSPAIDELGLIAYAGFPLADVDGNVVGAVCAIDSAPHAWSADDTAILARLAALAAQQLAAPARDGRPAR